MAQSLFDVVFGIANPSGKLPVTMPNEENEQHMEMSQYPGVNHTAVYSEHLLNGYRWYDAHHITPAFPFGHGISYTNFRYDNIKVDGRRVTA